MATAADGMSVAEWAASQEGDGDENAPKQSAGPVPQLVLPAVPGATSPPAAEGSGESELVPVPEDNPANPPEARLPSRLQRASRGGSRRGGEDFVPYHAPMQLRPSSAVAGPCTWQQLWKLFNAKSMLKVEQDFVAAGNCMDVVEFTACLERHLPITPNGRLEKQVVSAIVDLFQRADLDGVGTLKWEWFTMFLVETGMEFYHGADLAMSAPSAQYRNSGIKGHVFTRCLDRMRYCETLDRLVAVEKGSTDVQLIDSRTGVVAATLGNDDGRVLAVEHLPDINFLVVAAKKLSLWDCTHNTLHNAVTVKHPITCLRWAPALSLLLSGSSNGNVYAWAHQIENPDGVNKFAAAGKSNMRTLVRKWSMRAHDDAVKDVLLVVDRRTALMTAGLDCKLKVWEIPSRQHRRTWQTTKGMTMLDYHRKHNLLISTGFEHCSFVWVERSPAETPIARLPHNALMVGGFAVQSLPQIVTMDVMAVVKVWDCRSFQPMQVLEVESSSPMSDSLGTFAVIDARAMLCCGGRAVEFLHTTNSEIAQSGCTDEHPIVYSHYNSTLDCFVTAAGGHVKIYDSDTGALRRVFGDVVPTEVTAICMDHRQVKLYVGDHAGNVVVFNAETGRQIKSLVPHDDEVSCLIYVKEAQRVLSASWDRTIGIHDENLSGRRSRRLLTSKSDELLCMASCPKLGVVAAGSAQGVVEAWKYSDGSVVRVFPAHSSELLCLEFVQAADGRIFLITADNACSLRIWTVSDYKFNRIVDFVNEDATGRLNPIVSMCLSSDETELFTGDDSGEVKVWDVASAFPVLRNATQNVATTRNVMSSPHNTADGLLTSQVGPASTAGLTSAALMSTAVGPNQLLLKHSWKAHSYVVSSLQYIPPTSSTDAVLLTGGLDCYARCWNMKEGEEGGMIGGLTQPKDEIAAEESNRQWNFVPSSQCKEQLLEQAVEVLEAMEMNELEKTALADGATQHIHPLALMNADANRAPPPGGSSDQGPIPPDPWDSISPSGSPVDINGGKWGAMQRTPSKLLMGEGNRTPRVALVTGKSPPKKKDAGPALTARERAAEWAGEQIHVTPGPGGKSGAVTHREDIQRMRNEFQFKNPVKRANMRATPAKMVSLSTSTPSSAAKGGFAPSPPVRSARGAVGGATTASPRAASLAAKSKGSLTART